MVYTRDLASGYTDSAFHELLHVRPVAPVSVVPSRISRQATSPSAPWWVIQDATTERAHSQECLWTSDSMRFPLIAYLRLHTRGASHYELQQTHFQQSGTAMKGQGRNQTSPSLSCLKDFKHKFAIQHIALEEMIASGCGFTCCSCDAFVLSFTVASVLFLPLTSTLSLRPQIHSHYFPLEAGHHQISEERSLS